MFNNKTYYRKLEKLLDAIQNERHPHQTLARMVDNIIAEFSDTLGTISGRLYTRSDDVYICRYSTETLGRNLDGVSIPASYKPVTAILENRVVAIHDDFPGYDPELESSLNVRNFAAFSLDNGRYLISFGLDKDTEGIEDSLVFALSTIQHSLGLRLRQAAMEAEISEAEAIQLSLLPTHPPSFEGFDIAAGSFAAESTEVGGDIHDFIPLGADALGIAVGDASGHGLPAALQARDVVTGLRMGVEKEFKVTAVMRRLNRVIHASRLTTRFVSLFYAELECDGNLIYVNAGHCEPIVLGPRGKIERLDTGGMILGPMADTEYKRGFTVLEPGRQMMIFSDGLVERMNKHEEHFGDERLINIFRECYTLSAAETVELTMEKVRAFGGSEPWEDDVTMIVIKPTP
ncbi:MAG: PP2C family protein-serine/threonine phosphatase [bacterium]|nr:PP2C family protein-serine/threonine phosphatase [bacterium]